MNEGDSFRFDLWLYNEMQKREWNLMDLSRASGLHHATLGYYITGTRLPTLASFALILKALGKHIEIVDN